MHRRLRELARRPGSYAPWADVALALVISVVAVWLVWQSGTVHYEGDGKAEAPGPDIVTEPLAPRPPPGRVVSDHPDMLWVTVVGTLLVTLPIAVRRRWPLAVFVVQFLAVFAVGDDNTGPTVVALLVGAYTLGVRRSPLVTTAVLLGAATIVAAVFNGVELPLPGWMMPFVILLPFGLFGITVRALRARAAAAAGRAEALRAGQEAATRAAVIGERTRLARELHDVVSHHVSVMVIQAGAAGKVFETRPDLARQALASVTDSGRQAMGELRHLLGVLAADSDHSTDEDRLRPQPGLAEIGALVEKVRAAGQPVTLRQPAAGVPPDVPRGVGTAAYRVVQEALTNALRYAPGAPTTVIIEPDGDILTVEVTDEGIDAAQTRVPGLTPPVRDLDKPGRDSGASGGGSDTRDRESGGRDRGAGTRGRESGGSGAGSDMRGRDLGASGGGLGTRGRESGGPGRDLDVHGPALGVLGGGSDILGRDLGALGRGSGVPGRGSGVSGTGSGLRGLVERVRLYGGTLEAGRRITGGFRVSARLPIDTPSGPSE